MAKVSSSVPRYKNISELKKAARAFAKEVVRPVGIKLDRLQDPEQVIHKDSPLWDVYREFHERGFRHVIIPKAFGGYREDLPSIAQHILFEQMGYGDAGLAISLAAQCMTFYIAVISQDKQIRSLAQEFIEDKDANMIGCWAITEPEHGSDWVLGTTPKGKDPRLAPTLRAIKQGDEYILNGQKSAWVSNGTIASHAILHVGIDQARGMHGHVLMFCPLDLPGISKGKPLNKIGQRPLNQGEIYFDEVRLHKKHVLIPGLWQLGAVSRGVLGRANMETGMIFSGLSMAVFDEALKYAKNKRVGGKPLFEQQYIRMKLFNMFTKAESATAFAHKAAAQQSSTSVPKKGLRSAIISSKTTYAALGKGLPAIVNRIDRFSKTERGEAYFDRMSRSSRAKKRNRGNIYGVACKVLTTQTSFDLASEAMQIFGMDGVNRDYPIEKMLRDARASLIEDGTNEMIALAASEDL